MHSYVAMYTCVYLKSLEQMCEAWEEGLYYGALNNRVLTTDFSKNACWTHTSSIRYVCV